MSHYRSLLIRSLLCLVGLLPFAANAQLMSNPSPRLGYAVSTFDSGFSDSPVGLCFDDSGHMYVLLINGELLVYTDPNHDGVFDSKVTFWPGTNIVYPATGVTYHEGKLYVAHMGFISTIEDINSDSVGDVFTTIVAGLPVGLHQNNQMVFDENDILYFGLGSQLDHAAPTNNLSATILSCNDDGTNLQVYASGMRNAFGIAYKQGFGLVCSENGWNAVPSELNPPDELNLVLPGRNYGFPLSTGSPPPGSGIESPMAILPPHSAPTGLTFDLQGEFSGYEHDLFVSFVAGAAGAVARVSVFKSPTTGEWRGFAYPIVTGILGPIDCKFSGFGELFVADFTGLNIFRVVRTEPTRISVTGEPAVARSIGITFDAGASYANAIMVLAMSGAEIPFYVSPSGKVLSLDVNHFLFNPLTLTNIMHHFAIPTILDAAGTSFATMYIPNVPGAIGYELFFAGLTVDLTLDIGAVSDTLPFRILPQ